jgi:hypothetical protein
MRQIAPFVPTYLAQLLAFDVVPEHDAAPVYRDADKASCCRRPLLGLSQFDEQHVTRQAHRKCPVRSAVRVLEITDICLDFPLLGGCVHGRAVVWVVCAWELDANGGAVIA